MKTQNSVSQVIIILHKINKEGYFKQKCLVSENVYALNVMMRCDEVKLNEVRKDDQR